MPVARIPLIALVLIASISTTTISAFVHPFSQPSPRHLIRNLERSSTSRCMEAVDDDGGKTSSSIWDRLESLIFAPLESTSENGDGADDEDPRLILAEWKSIWEETEVICDENHGFVKNKNVTASAPEVLESLSNFLETWAQITLQNDKGLTTPVSSTKFKENSHPSTIVNLDRDLAGSKSGNDNANDGSNWESSRSMKLVFRPPKRYLSYKEQKSMEKNGVIPDRKGAKVDAWSPGGVEIQVITCTATTASLGVKSNDKVKRSLIGVTAIRCDIDGDTVIKKTSERAIIRRLDAAIRVWRKSYDKKIDSKKYW